MIQRDTETTININISNLMMNPGSSNINLPSLLGRGRGRARLVSPPEYTDARKTFDVSLYY